MTGEFEASAVDPVSIGTRMARGSMWMVLLRWTMRLTGFFSTIILARLLVPSDFGIIAMAMIVVGFLETFAELGVDLALIRNVDATRRHYDTAWTFRILQGAVLAAIIALVAPVAAASFDEPRLTPVIQVLSLRALIEGFENIGVVAFRKELEFAKEFRYRVYSRLLVFVLTVGGAIILRSYWALVIGMIGGPLLGVALSYIMHPYRPRASISAFSEIWSFSRWVLANNLGQFLFREIDKVVVARVAGTEAMGIYSVGLDLATMPTRAAVLPIEIALFSGYAKLISAPAAMAQTYLTVLGVVSIMTVSIGVGIAAIADDLVLVILGQTWMATTPVVEWLAIFGTISGFTYGVNTLLTATGRINVVVLRTWAQVGLLAPAVAVAGALDGVTAIAMTRTIVAGLFMVVSYRLLLSTGLVSAGQVLGTVWRPIMAGTIMFVVLRTIDLGMINGPLFRLSTEILLGIASFLTSLLLLWVLAGRPHGPETAALQLIRRSPNPVQNSR